MASEEVIPPAKRPKMMRRKSSIVLARQRTGTIASVAEPERPSLNVVDSMAAAREMFRQSDADGNGVLDYAEFRALMQRLGRDQERLNESYIEHVISVADKDRDGSISLEEFEQVYAGIRKMDQLLHAPRPQAIETTEAPVARSILKDEETLICPPIETVALDREAAEHVEDEADADAVSAAPFRVDRTYSDLRWLGQGGFGMVCSATDGRDGSRVAIKRVSPTHDVLQIKCCLREIAILEHFGKHPHENIIGLREVLRPPGGGHLSEWRDLYIASELMETDLQKLIKSDAELPGPLVLLFVWQLLRGVHALHAAGVLHRDIKPSNLLVNTNGELKITDFGISRSCHPVCPTQQAKLHEGVDSDDAGRSSGSNSSTDVSATSGRIVTLWYRPPELLCGNSTYGPSVDMWSVGVVVAEILGRSPPFYAEAGPREHLKMLRQILAQLGRPDEDDLAMLELPDAVKFLRKISSEPAVPEEPPPWNERLGEAPAPALDLIAKLVCFHPRRRLSAADALRHVWFAGLHHDSDLDERPARCEFPFEAYPDPHLDHFLIAALDALKWKRPDYPLEVTERARFETYGRAPAQAAAALEWEHDAH